MNNNLKSNVKKHIPKDWLCELRILYRLAKETFNDVIRTGWVNIVIITTMAAILMIFGACFRTALSISSFSKELGKALEISVYLKNSTDAREAKNEISQFEHVENITIIPKAESWGKLKSEMSLPNIDNPLPDTLHVKVDNPENLQVVFDNIKQIKSVEDMSYAKDLASKIELVNHVVKTITLVVILIMGLLTITIINNTIQLVIQSRKDEIEIMRLMGVSNWYIRFPFISISSFSKELGKALEISVYLKNSTDAREAKNEISQFEHVENITIIPKAESWGKLKSEMSLPNIDNPLPDTLHVKVDNPENLQVVFDNIKQIKSVEDMSYAKDLASKIELVNHVVKTITLVVILIMGLLTITIINNTIQLVIQSRKDEIEIMRLMGVSNWYIRFPFIMQGALYGLTGSLLALIPLNYVQNGLVHIHRFFMIPSPAYAQNLVVLVMFSMSILFGAIGSFWCIKKHLQV